MGGGEQVTCDDQRVMRGQIRDMSDMCKKQEGESAILLPTPTCSSRLLLDLLLRPRVLVQRPVLLKPPTLLKLRLRGGLRDMLCQLRLVLIRVVQDMSVTDSDVLCRGRVDRGERGQGKSSGLQDPNGDCSH